MSTEKSKKEGGYSCAKPAPKKANEKHVLGMQLGAFDAVKCLEIDRKPRKGGTESAKRNSVCCFAKVGGVHTAASDLEQTREYSAKRPLRKKGKRYSSDRAKEKHVAA